MVGAGSEVFFPRPFVLEGHQLINVSLAVDDALVGGIDPSMWCRNHRRGRVCMTEVLTVMGEFAGA